jgi:hypothetical protein
VGGVGLFREGRDVWLVSIANWSNRFGSPLDCSGMSFSL